MGERRIEPAPGIAKAWQEFREAMNNAASRFTGQATFALPPFHAHSLPGVNEDMDRHLSGQPNGTTISADQDAAGALFYLLRTA